MTQARAMEGCAKNDQARPLFTDRTRSALQRAPAWVSDQISRIDHPPDDIGFSSRFSSLPHL